MPVVWLTEDDVHRLIDMPASIEVVQRAFAELAAGRSSNNPRRRAVAPGIVLHTMSAAAEYLGLVGFKAYTTTNSGARFHVAAYDASSGQLVALIEANWLGQLRTGATSGVAARHMARDNASRVGLFGTGLQARTQLRAVCLVRPISRVDVFSRDAERRAAFAAELAEFCQTDIVAVDSPDQAVRDKDIVITATTAKTPVFPGQCLAPGTHLNVIGSNFLAKTEVDVETIRRADRIVCDSIEACRIEAGDFVEPLQTGMVDWRQMHELADVVAGRVVGRASDEEITLFKSVGLAIEDLALAAELIDRALSAGVGQTLPI